MNNNMNEVVVLGLGMHPFGRWPDKSTIDLAEVAIAAALDDAGVPFRDIEAAYLGSELGHFTDARMIIQNFAWTGIPISQMQQACASGSAAFREAYQAVASGRHEVALVVGYEKMGAGLLPGGSPEADREFHLHYMGLDLTPARIAMAMQQRFALYGDTPEMLAAEAVQAFEYGALNPHAHYRKTVTVEEVLAAPMICSPLTRLMCCPTSDGAAAVVICSRKKAEKYGLARAVTVAGFAAGSPDSSDLVGGPGPHIGGDFRSGNLTRRVTAEAYEMAGIGPEEVDVVQCHAPFAGGGAICAEALGFCKEGEGGRFFLDGEARIEGRTPINTDGGLLSRGHPLGATGVAEIIEIVRQLRGEAGALQVPNRPKVGLAHNTGLGCLNTHVFKV
ncbi:MAG: thiolase family protein [Pseudomonadota bacterium]